MAKIKREEFNGLLYEFAFKELFISYLGWNNPKGQLRLPALFIKEREYNIIAIAQRSGFQILTCEVDDIPTQSECRKLDGKLRRQANDYILIFFIPGSEHQCWVCPVTQKREIVLIEYTQIDKTNFLYEKLDSLTFRYDESLPITDVRDRVHHAFSINSEKITKDFYIGFRKEHKEFAEFISGITEEKDRQWYTSVMLNRLMFCYFIQKKGFLNGDTEYLRNKLNEVREEEGPDKFYHSFYRDFLLSLFHDGLNSPRHDRDWERRFGRIPYLNGGMFEIHQLEQKYADLDIADDAFIRLFTFFDTWQWHLDTRITASGKDINPDVLGYIFEQYINDRAAMGAYYTKEDITEYIAKNCIIPFLFDAVAKTSSRDDFKPTGYVWQTLKISGDKYIYDAVKKGYTTDWRDKIPENIAVGLDTDSPGLLERRLDWNTTTSGSFALPTEIWRETIERLQRCESLLQKIAHGEITKINDFITFNLNIRLFAEDLLLSESVDHRFVANFYHALQKITVLDPTCGSGAFLFAAMNVLEPLYEICINRMEEFHEKNQNLFKPELDEIASKYRSNIQYFIYKSIILRNLYGVDIMVEATEIAKLRLFLKMVAVVEVDKKADNLGLDPLPDIDFNIRCGNTLVGYANKSEIDCGMVDGGIFAAAEFRDKVDSEMKLVATTYKTFKRLQMVQSDDMMEFKKAKSDLRDRLAELNHILNRHMHKSVSLVPYSKWLSSTQPFHWLAEFYDIIVGNGGFDVIIGNPPYVSISKIKYLKIPQDYKCTDLYAYVIRRSLQLLSPRGTHGFIVMHNLAFSRGFADLREMLKRRKGTKWFSFYSRIPSGLFSGDVRVRNCIYILSSTGTGSYTTRMHRWFTEQRETLFPLLHYNKFIFSSVVPMLNDSRLQAVYENTKGLPLDTLRNSGLDKRIYFKRTAYNWLAVSNSNPPAFDKNNMPIKQTKVSDFCVTAEYYEYILLLLAGKIILSKWLTYGDDFDLTSDDLLTFIFPFDRINCQDHDRLLQLYHDFSHELSSTVQYKLNAGKRVGTYNTMKLWNITEQSDRIFLKYIVSDQMVEEYMQMIEDHLGKCVITTKKSVSTAGQNIIEDVADD